VTRTDNHWVAQAAHDLGSALWLGGSVMGIAGVNKSGSELTQGIDRVRVASSTAYAAYSGSRIGKLAEEAERSGTPVQVKDATLPTQGTPPEIEKWQRRQRVTQFAVPLLAGANIVCGSWLVQSYRAGSTLKGVVGRLLPG